MITLSNVTRRYYLEDKTPIDAVNNLTLEIQKGEFVVIIGRSGSGKTTLLNLMAGLTRPSTGNIAIDGMDLQKLSDRELSMLRNRKIGFVFQFPSLLPSLKVIENVKLPCDFFNENKIRADSERAVRLLEMVGLGSRQEAYPKQLSAGEQKRAVIARALINEPNILLADEPTSDLDEKTEREVIELLLGIRSRGATIVMATHNLQLVSIASKALKMEQGILTEIPTQGTTAEQVFNDK